MATKGRAARPNVRKPKPPREALEVICTAGEHIRGAIQEYLAHKLPRPIAGDDVESVVAASDQRALRLLILRHLRRFTDAVKAYLAALSTENEKSIGWHLGLERRPGRPKGHKSSKSLDRAREISERRETESETRKTRQGKPTRTMWKKVGGDDISDQAARKRVKRALPSLTEEKAKEIVARLKQHSNQKPPPIGKAKARSIDMTKNIRARNRRKRKGRHQSRGPNGPLK